uniref:Uncharacterized protein n=1 Tax=Fundulus heteroclitus TaxID=8078 RepID=A0A3Q2QSR5_FUNHE
CSNCEQVLFDIESLKHLKFADTRMEVSRRRVLLRHLEPARPLRRCVHSDVGNAHFYFTTYLVQIEDTCILDLGFLFSVERISYTREVLIGLASCPEAKKRPEYLPDHPIVGRKIVLDLFFLTFFNQRNRDCALEFTASLLCK